MQDAQYLNSFFVRPVENEVRGEPLHLPSAKSLEALAVELLATSHARHPCQILKRLVRGAQKARRGVYAALCKIVGLFAQVVNGGRIKEDTSTHARRLA